MAEEIDYMSEVGFVLNFPSICERLPDILARVQVLVKALGRILLIVVQLSHYLTVSLVIDYPDR
jgi:hypothetical protein